METIHTLLLPHSISSPLTLITCPSSSLNLSFLFFWASLLSLSLSFSPSPSHRLPLFSPIRTYWGVLDHEIKILASDITEYFQFSGMKKVRSVVVIKVR